MDPEQLKRYKRINLLEMLAAVADFALYEGEIEFGLDIEEVRVRYREKWRRPYEPPKLEPQ